jgi:hypothetical protein
MATKLKEFDFSHQSRLTAPGGKDSYPWDDWFDGDIWQIDYGTDFDSHPLMMERIIRTRIVGREGKVTLRHIGVGDEPWGSIVMQRTDIEGPTARKRREASAKRAAKRAEVSTPRTVDKPAVKQPPAVKKLAKANGAVSKKAPTKKLALAK